MNLQRGTKRVCATCGTKFYDLLTKPVCPKCDAEFIIPVPPPPRRPARMVVRTFQPAPIVAGSADDVPEVDEEESVTTEDEDESDEKPAVDEADIEG
ncbi:MAG: FYDLN acid domain-containing protein [Beijerinckiaceae bacterium]